eukprot:gene22374-28970_t
MSSASCGTPTYSHTLQRSHPLFDGLHKHCNALSSSIYGTCCIRLSLIVRVTIANISFRKRKSKSLNTYIASAAAALQRDVQPNLELLDDFKQQSLEDLIRIETIGIGGPGAELEKIGMFGHPTYDDSSSTMNLSPYYNCVHLEGRKLTVNVLEAYRYRIRRKKMLIDLLRNLASLHNLLEQSSDSVVSLTDLIASTEEKKITKNATIRDILGQVSEQKQPRTDVLGVASKLSSKWSDKGASL